MIKKYFNLVLHSHLPYVKKAGRWPFGEEWFFEAMLETYIPLSMVFYRLVNKGIDFKLTLGVTPVLAEQMLDPYMIYETEKYIETKIESAYKDLEKYNKENRKETEVIRFYINYLNEIFEFFKNKISMDVLGFWRKLQDEGYLDIITSSATHAYLPLLKKKSSIYAQLYVGKEVYMRNMKKEPKGIWLPECAYKPGIEKFLEELGIRYFFVDTHTILGGEPLSYPDLNVKREKQDKNIYKPYLVSGSNVAVFGRDSRTGMQVWSAEWGYPGDGVYREFHKRSETSGLQYWRITDKRKDLGEKDVYDPQIAKGRVYEHAEHFVRVLEDEIKSDGIITAMYDTELFGHWWFEGVWFLERIFELLNESKKVKSINSFLALEKCPPDERIELPESSWGRGGKHEVWLNDETVMLWEKIYEIEEENEKFIDKVKITQLNLWKEKVIRQACREKLLLESSDWPFLITTGQAKEYGYKRFEEHYSNYKTLLNYFDLKEVSVKEFEYLKKLENKDSLFSFIDYNIFERR
ncbi:MAG: 1,4-alpha-glucan branching protein domain-containing protein [Dictyoglomus sp.]